MRERSRAHLVAGVVAALLLLPGAAFGQASEVGLIESFRGQASGYLLERGGKKIPVAVFRPLHTGDHLAVLDPDGEIRLRVGPKRVIVLTRDDGSHIVAADTGQATVAGNLARWVGDWLTANDPNAASGVSLATRAGAPALVAPLLAGDETRLLGGSRSLHLAWQGGVPPFRVRVATAAGGDVVAELGRVEGRRAETGTVAWRPGDYRIEIRDADGQRVDATLRVTDDGPDLPGDLSPLPDGSPLRATLEAAWLASVGSGEWLLEGYQRAADLAGAYPPAALVRDAVERRDRPPVPDVAGAAP